jgi:uncharacterized protein (UPF0303 family)
MDYTLESLLAQEASLELDHFSNDDAWALGSALMALARSRRLPIAVSIVRGGQRLFHYAAPGTTHDNDLWLERKLATVLHFGHSSLYLERKLKEQGSSLLEKYGLGPASYVAAGGAFPLVIRGTGLVGGAAVSGLKSEEDHDLVVEALREFARPS